MHRLCGFGLELKDAHLAESITRLGKNLSKASFPNGYGWPGKQPNVAFFVPSEIVKSLFDSKIIEFVLYFLRRFRGT